MSPSRYLSLAVIVGLGVFLVYVSMLPESERVQYMPDDAFYYLAIADHPPSFDGITKTSGFHPAWMWLLMLLPSSSLTPLLVGGIIGIAACFLCWRKLKTDAGHLALALIAGTGGFALNIVGGMESGLLLFVIAIGWYAVEDGRWNLAGVLSAIAILTRPEAVVLVGAVWYFHRRNEILLGAAAGLVGWFGGNLLISDDPLSSSVRMKSHWTQFYDPVNLFRRNAGQVVIWTLGIPVAGIYLLALLVGLAFKRYWVFGAATLALLFVLGRLEWVQSWHVTIILPLIFLAIAPPLFDACGKWAAGLVAVVATLGAMNAVNLYATPPYPTNILTYVAGKSPINVRVGAFNAGIMGYFSGGNVTNLDGLVNDEVQPYIVRNDLAGYLASRNIKHIVDFDSCLMSQSYRIRGGYPEGLNVKPIHTFGNSREFGALRLWEVQ